MKLLEICAKIACKHLKLNENVELRGTKYKIEKIGEGGSICVKHLIPLCGNQKLWYYPATDFKKIIR